MGCKRETNKGHLHFQLPWYTCQVHPHLNRIQMAISWCVFYKCVDWRLNSDDLVQLLLFQYLLLYIVDEERVFFQNIQFKVGNGFGLSLGCFPFPSRPASQPIEAGQDAKKNLWNWRLNLLTTLLCISATITLP